MNEQFNALCTKYGLSELAVTEFRNLFEKEIINVFYKESARPVGPAGPAGTAKTAKAVQPGVILCLGVKKSDGTPCTSKAKENGFCGKHDPSKGTAAAGIVGATAAGAVSTTATVATTAGAVAKTGKKCNAVIPKTGNPCAGTASYRPDGATHYYCKRHSKIWINFEQPVEGELVMATADEM